VDQITRIGLDRSKSVFQLHGADQAEKLLFRRKLARRELIKLFERLPPTLVALEACGASHLGRANSAPLGIE
jgi:transposase